jgi:hypothetical protein
MPILQVQGVFTEDNLKSIYFPTLLKAAGFLPTAFFLPLQQKNIYLLIFIHPSQPSPKGEGANHGLSHLPLRGK